MERIRGIGESRGHVTAWFGFVEMRMKYDVCAMPRSPADRFRIPPTFMANRDTKCQRTGLENAPPGASRIGTLLGGVELHFVLETPDRPIPIDDQGSDQQRTVDDAFGAENDSEIRLRGSRCNDRPGAFEEHRVGRRRGLAHSSVTGNKAFRKADDARAFDGRLSNGVFG